MSVKYDMSHPFPAPTIAFESTGFWDGVRERRLVFQRCVDCGQWVHPPRPACPKCRSLNKEWARSSGKGVVHSYVTYHESPDPAFKTPYSVVLVEMEEGVRLVSNMFDVDPGEITIGMAVEIVFDEISEGLILPKFRKTCEMR